MRNLLNYTGILILLGGLGLMFYSGLKLWDLYKLENLSFNLLNPAYWLLIPDDFLGGFTPQGKLTGYFAGGFVILFIGKHLQNLSVRMD
jgi:hypothetical protein